MSTARTPLFLMANLGSEFFQVFSFVKSGKRSRAEKAGARAQQIIADLKTSSDMHGRTFELDILSNIITDVLQQAPALFVTQEQMQSYFEPFVARFSRVSLGV